MVASSSPISFSQISSLQLVERLLCICVPCDTWTFVTGGSEDGRSLPRLGDVGRSDSGEVEMTDFQRPGPSSEEPAGTQAGGMLLHYSLTAVCLLDAQCQVAHSAKMQFRWWPLWPSAAVNYNMQLK